ncbi:GNAT family N-acetyltransferase [Candidatus Amarolinea aalborgensis]|jgi:ribosomal-protein-alanine N-acetyltransferase|uniref:GNAT family N-acetyltransferase n=1 Tax=Candidatus Amarolinea aalborgensis TaxID=2249329 RepID=UPI003BF99BD7
MNDHDAQANTFHVTVRAARPDDQARILTLLDQTRRQMLTFGTEDLPALLTSDQTSGAVAETGPLLWGFLLTSLLAQPTLPGETLNAWATLRGCALLGGWRADEGLPALWEPVAAALRSRRVQAVVHIAAAEWLHAPLQRLGFQISDTLEVLQRGVGIDHASDGVGPATLRSARPDEILALQAVDSAAFAPPWRATAADLTGLLVMSSHAIVAEMEGQVMGYAVSDVRGEFGVLARLAVLPAAQGQGLGRQLLTDALRFCRRSGARSVSLNTKASNQASQRLYAQHGFRLLGKRTPVMTFRLPTAAR